MFAILRVPCNFWWDYHDNSQNGYERCSNIKPRMCETDTVRPPFTRPIRERSHYHVMWTHVTHCEEHQGQHMTWPSSSFAQCRGDPTSHTLRIFGHILAVSNQSFIMPRPWFKPKTFRVEFVVDNMTLTHDPSSTYFIPLRYRTYVIAPLRCATGPTSHHVVTTTTVSKDFNFT
jgi:hypothetical protein